MSFRSGPQHERRDVLASDTARVLGLSPLLKTIVTSRRFTIVTIAGESPHGASQYGLAQVVVSR